MCGRPPEPAPLPTPPPVSSRNPDLVQQSDLPSKKKLTDEDDVTSVQYGSSNKLKNLTARGTGRVGAAGLRIPLNTGASTGASTGGINTTV
tara:strand:- start:845 stop:1117 length:273 start_codon:yes stop_codon:yes gene_type:complete